MATCTHCGYESEDGVSCPLCGASMPGHQPGGAEAPAEEPETARPSGARARSGGSDTETGGGNAETGGGAHQTASAGPGGGSGHRGGPGAPRTDAPSHEIPAWEDAGVAFPRNFVETLRDSCLDPGRFFAGVPFERPALRPILYYLFITIIGAFFTLWWGAVFTAAQVSIFGALDGLREAGFEVMQPTVGSALLNFFLAPFAALVTLVIWALLLHLFVFMLAKNRRTLTATVRAICYASGPTVLNVVPFLGGLIGAVWSLVLLVIGLREAHRMTTGAAVGVVVLGVVVPAIAVVCLVLFVFVLAFAAA